MAFLKKSLVFLFLCISFAFALAPSSNYEYEKIGSVSIEGGPNCVKCTPTSSGTWINPTDGPGAVLPPHPCCDPEGAYGEISVPAVSGGEGYSQYVIEYNRLDGGICTFPDYVPHDQTELYFYSSKAPNGVGIPLSGSIQEGWESNDEDYAVVGVSMPNYGGRLRIWLPNWVCDWNLAIYQKRAVSATLYAIKEKMPDVPQVCENYCEWGEEQMPYPNCECISQECDDYCPEGQAQMPYPDCECVPAQVKSMGGKIYYEDFQWDSFATSFFGIAPLEQRGLFEVHYKFEYGGREYEGYTNVNGDYLIEFNPPLQIVEGQVGEFSVIMEDKGNKIYVGEGSGHQAPPNQAFFSGKPAEFAFGVELIADENGEDLRFDVPMADENWVMQAYAKVYYNTWLSLNYAEEVLNEKMSKAPIPEPVLITPENDTAYHTGPFGIAIGDRCAIFTYPDAPINREFHEFGHHVQYDAFERMPYMTGDTNHGSYANPTSTDSVVEGWAEVFALLVNEFNGGKYPSLYPVGTGVENIEVNHKIVGRGVGPNVPDEEIVAASLLWDFVDGKNKVDEDYVQVSAEKFWSFFRGKYKFSDGTEGNIYNLADLYDASQTQGGWDLQEDGDKDGINNLDELFIAHGIFKDDNGNGGYDAGEKIGVTLNSASNERRKIQPKEGASLAVNVRDDSGNPIDAVFVVEIEFEPPYDIYDYEYSVPLPADEKSLDLAMPRGDYGATATISAYSPGYSQKPDAYTITNKQYWEKVNKGGKDFDSLDIVLDYQGGFYCESNSDCTGGQICNQGICMEATVECEYDSQCPEGYSCVGGECSEEGTLCAFPALIISLPFAFWGLKKKKLFGL
ncbi:hypothetical protein COU37_01040 [Candidatus Micrarchaeota archaeon CG10_big_fil_rev_8_21_14_0_10_45_29]|nr:MAG: hypothetical protein COU37_01040 [Candidatus Micrarchaeota archaeon CG10_big_fil_rev_8_21_14_0_10_45_29]